MAFFCAPVEWIVKDVLQNEPLLQEEYRSNEEESILVASIFSGSMSARGSNLESDEDIVW